MTRLLIQIVKFQIQVLSGLRIEYNPSLKTSDAMQLRHNSVARGCPAFAGLTVLKVLKYKVSYFIILADKSLTMR